MDQPNEDPRPTVRRTLSGWSQREGKRVWFELSDVEPGPPHPPKHMPFVVHETPHVMWDHALADRNLDFLKGIDPGYFRHVAEVHAPFLGSESQEARQRAATALRMAYSVALETFCALLATTIQSPRFALGWMVRYKNRDLEGVIRKLYRGEPVHSAWSDPFSWLSISEAVHRVPVEGATDEEEQQIKVAFAQAWRRFAAEFIDQNVADEYNSLKHGLRARAGGFQISVGASDSSGEAPPPESMTKPSGSHYGSSYFTAGRIGERRNWVLTERSQNSVPDNLIAGLVLLTISINNLVWFLRNQGGDPTPQELQKPGDAALFTKPWEIKLEFDRHDLHPLVTEEQLSMWTEDELKTAFAKK